MQLLVDEHLADDQAMIASRAENYGIMGAENYGIADNYKQTR